MEAARANVFRFQFVVIVDYDSTQKWCQTGRQGNEIGILVSGR
jgi:hypothetical protein